MRLITILLQIDTWHANYTMLVGFYSWYLFLPTAFERMTKYFASISNRVSQSEVVLNNVQSCGMIGATGRVLLDVWCDVMSCALFDVWCDVICISAFYIFVNNEISEDKFKF